MGWGGHERVQLCGLDGSVHIWVELRLLHVVVLPAGGAKSQKRENRILQDISDMDYYY